MVGTVRLDRVVVVALLFAGACFDPSYHQLACSAGECPSGYTCDPVDRVCQPNGADVDAPVGGAIAYLPMSEATFGTGDWTFDASYTLNTSTVISGGAALPAGVRFELGTMNDGATVAILRVHDLTIPAGLALGVSGDHPLAILAGGSVVLDGTIDANGYLDLPGPNGSVQGAGLHAGQGGTMATAGVSGGGGGGYVTGGGAGGSAEGAVGGAGGSFEGLAVPTSLRGGSGGGGAVSACNTTVRGGGGGGAVFVYAATAIVVNGAIRAGGGGGRAAVGCNTGIGGGSGGGAGGQIDLQSPQLSGTGRLTVAGGGGAGGHGWASSASPGLDGEHGGPLGMSSHGGPGGQGNPSGSQGGDGATAQQGATQGQPTATSNAGGGGGGAGLIVFRTHGQPSLRTNPTISTTTTTF